MWQLSSPSPFYSPPSPRRVFSDRLKTLSNCLTRSCSLLRVRQKGQRGPERDDERGRDEGRGRGLEQGMPTELSHAAIRGPPDPTSLEQDRDKCGGEEVAIKEQILTQLKCQRDLSDIIGTGLQKTIMKMRMNHG